MVIILSPRQWLLLLPPLFLSILLFSYLYTILWLRPERIRHKLRSQGVKGPKPSFLFGNIPEMRTIQKLATSDQEEGVGSTDRFSSNYVATLFPYFLHWRRVYGSIYLYATGSIQTLHVIDPDMVKELANCKSLDLGKPCYLRKEHGALLGMGIFTENGDLWVHQRKVIAPEFFMDKVKGMVNLMMDAALLMLNSWEEKVDTEGGRAEIVVDEFLRNFSADVISKASFGSSFIEGKEIFYKIRQLQKAIAKQSMLIGVPGSRSHHEWQSRARAEVLDVCHGEPLDFDKLWKLKTLTMVIQETLRLYPPASFVTREALNDLNLGGIDILKGTNIRVSIMLAHRDPSAWGASCDKFDPGRFSGGIARACKPHDMYMPFGVGPRTCAGQNLAMVELKVVLSMMLSRFEFALSPRYNHQPMFRLTVEPGNGMPLILRKL